MPYISHASRSNQSAALWIGVIDGTGVVSSQYVFTRMRWLYLRAWKASTAPLAEGVN